MHTFFTLKDVYGLHIDTIDEEPCLQLNKSKDNTYLSMLEIFQAWQEQSTKLDAGEITKEEYDQWWYTYPQIEITKS